MNELTEIKIRFSDAAYAIGSTQKALRNWLQRYDLHLTTDYTSRKWTEFTNVDIAILALTRTMVKWGIPVQDANKTAYSVIVPSANLLLQYKNTPRAALTAVFTAKTILVWGVELDDGPIYTVDPPEGKYRNSEDSFLTIAVGKIIEQTFARLDELSRNDDEGLKAQLKVLTQTIKNM